MEPIPQGEPITRVQVPSRLPLKRITVVDKIKVPKLGSLQVKERAPAGNVGYFSLNSSGEIYLNTKTRKSLVWSGSTRAEGVKDETIYRLIKNGVIRE